MHSVRYTFALPLIAASVDRRILSRRTPVNYTFAPGGNKLRPRNDAFSERNRGRLFKRNQRFEFAEEKSAQPCARDTATSPKKIQLGSNVSGFSIKFLYILMKILKINTLF